MNRRAQSTPKPPPSKATLGSEAVASRGRSARFGREPWASSAEIGRQKSIENGTLSRYLEQSEKLHEGDMASMFEGVDKKWLKEHKGLNLRESSDTEAVRQQGGRRRVRSNAILKSLSRHRHVERSEEES